MRVVEYTGGSTGSSLAEPNTFYADQFHNTDALLGYAKIGEELGIGVGFSPPRTAQ